MRRTFSLGGTARNAAWHSMWSQVDGLGLANSRVLGRRRQWLFAHVEEVECEKSDKHEDARYAVRQERALCSCRPYSFIHSFIHSYPFIYDNDSAIMYNENM